MLRPNELIDRWKTVAGTAIRERVIAALMANVDIRLILKELPGADEVFNWTDFRGIDLSHFTLSSDLFVAASLDFACLNHCEFTNSAFDNASLLYATFDGAKFFRTQITEAMILHASFENATFEKVLMMGSNLSYSSFRRAIIVESSLERCKCICSNFGDSILQRIDFDGATLAHVNFSGAKTIDSKFEGTRIHNTILPVPA